MLSEHSFLCKYAIENKSCVTESIIFWNGKYVRAHNTDGSVENHHSIISIEKLLFLRQIDLFHS